jgi:hypothetical protein
MKSLTTSVPASASIPDSVITRSKERKTDSERKQR